MAASHDLDPFLSLLKREGTLVLLGAPEHTHPSPSVFNLLFAPPLAGRIVDRRHQGEAGMLDYCAEKHIVSDIELIPVQQINEAYQPMVKGDVKYRFVIDMKTL